MMTDLELFHAFEQYLNGSMNGTERETFERMVREYSEVREKLSSHKEFMNKLRNYSERKKIKSLLLETQRQMDLEDQHKRKRTPNASYLAIAASFAGIVLLTATFYFGYYSGNRTDYSYLETSKKLNSIEAKQEAILKNLGSRSVKKVLREAEISGTGFMVSTKGYILTNCHLIKDADSVWVYNEAQSPVKAEVISRDTRYDLALLRITPDRKLQQQQVPYGFRKKYAEPGEEVFTIGYPREDMVYGEGSVSSSSGFQGDSLAYQISIPVNPGNSGGPLLDNAGNLTGIISGKQTMAEGTGFAVKSGYIEDFLRESLEKEGIKLSNRNNIAWMNRKDKVKRLRPFVFQVKVYQ